MKDRVRRIFRLLKSPVDAIVVANSTEPHVDMTFAYATGVESGLFEGSVAVLTPNGGTTIITGALEAESARSAPDAEVIEIDSMDSLRKSLGKSLRGRKSVGLNYRELTHATYLFLKKTLPDHRFSDVSPTIATARTVKDKEEIARLREAAHITSKVAREIPGMLRSGMTELELASEVEYHMGRLGSAGPSFKTIVAFGPHGAEPHFEPTRTKLKKGMTMVIDYGAIYQRYCSDCTRSFAFGHPPKQARAIHEVVEAAQQAAFEVIRPGVSGADVHKAAEQVINASKWKGRFIHGLGHSIGLAVHDGGVGLSPRSKEKLEVGMCLTVEPGIYVPGFGGVRIEDDIVVTKDGYEMLTDAPRGYLEVKG